MRRRRCGLPGIGYSSPGGLLGHPFPTSSVGAMPAADLSPTSTRRLHGNRRSGRGIIAPMRPTAVPSSRRRPGRRAAARGRAPPLGTRHARPARTGTSTYYVFDAAAYLGGGIVEPIGDDPPPCGSPTRARGCTRRSGSGSSRCSGVGPIGQRSIGWRLPSAVFGIAGVALLYLLALRLWRSVWWAGFAALLLALDGLHIVQSRMAMLDIFLTTFITAAMLFLVLDRERMDARPRSRSMARGSIGSSARRTGCGPASSSGAPSPRSGRARSRCRSRRASARSGCSPATGAAIGRPSRPSATLVASLRARPARRSTCSATARSSIQHGFAIHDFLTLQCAMLHYQQAHLAVQPENSPPWTWPLLLHPVRYFERDRATARRASIVALGNPALWWGFLAAAAVRARADRPPARLAGRGRLRRLRGDVPPVVRGRADAVHLVHAAGRPVHVPGRRRRRSAAARAGRPRRRVAVGVAIGHRRASRSCRVWTGWPVADALARARSRGCPDWPL